MSPSYFYATDFAAHEFGQYATGFADYDWVTGTWYGLRPVIKDIMVMMLDN